MFNRILTSALIAGAAAGLIAALLQLVFVQPVLLHAELYEGGELVHFTGEPAEGHDHGDHAHGADAAPAEAAPPPELPGFDFTRDGLSILFTALVYAGYGLLLTAAIALAEQRGHAVTPRQGLLWGIAGYITVQFAPAAGLPPELPGMAAAELGARQLWWIATVAATAVGLWLLAFGRGWAAWAPAVILLAAPHVIGAPHPHELTGPTPPELASLFAGRALGVGLAAWILLGLFAATLWSRDRQAA